MSEADLHAALDRLARAVDRIERSAGWREGASQDLAESYLLLQERHELLRDRIGQTIARLDAMIGAEERG